MHVFGAVISTQSLVVLARGDRPVLALHLLLQQDAARPHDAGDGAKPDAGANSRRSGRAHGALHLSDQRRAGRHRLDPDQPDLSRQIHQRRDLGMAAFLAAIIGGFNQVRGAILGGIILGVLDNLSAAYLSSQYRARVSAVHPDRRDHVCGRKDCSAASRSARYEPRLGAHRARGRRDRRDRRAVLLKPFGIYLISMWAVLTDRRNRSQSDARLCRAGVDGAGRLRRHRRLYLGAADAGRRAVIRWPSSPPACCVSSSAGCSAIRRCASSTIISPSSHWPSRRWCSCSCATRNG